MNIIVDKKLVALAAGILFVVLLAYGGGILFSIKPNAPVVTGPHEAVGGQMNSWAVVAIDPDGGNIRYSINWADGTGTDWSDWVPSGTAVTFNHIFPVDRIGWTVNLEVKAHDESQYARTFYIVTIIEEPDPEPDVVCWRCNPVSPSTPESTVFSPGTVCGYGDAVDWPYDSQPTCSVDIVCWKCNGDICIATPGHTVCDNSLGFYDTEEECVDAGCSSMGAYDLTVNIMTAGCDIAVYGQITGFSDTRLGVTGSAVFENLNNDAYDVTVSKSGYENWHDVVVVQGSDKAVDVPVLEPKAVPGFEMMMVVFSVFIILFIYRVERDKEG